MPIDPARVLRTRLSTGTSLIVVFVIDGKYYGITEYAEV